MEKTRLCFEMRARNREEDDKHESIQKCGQQVVELAWGGGVRPAGRGAGVGWEWDGSAGYADAVKCVLGLAASINLA